MSVRDVVMGAAGAAGGAPVYIDDVFSNYLYVGDGANQNIVNGMDFVTNGGLCWVKSRSVSSTVHYLSDTARGNSQILFTNTNEASQSNDRLESLNSNGFSVKNDSSTNALNETYVSFSFLKKKKFFDIVTYTGDGSGSRAISHNLGAIPAFVIIKKTSAVGNWVVGHRSIGNNQFLELNGTGAASTDSAHFPNTARTDTEFYVGNDSDVNQNGASYIAYLFSHNAGGFGAAGTDNVVSCGIYTGNGSGTGPLVDLGFEPQWIMVKRATGGSGDWHMFDAMRGIKADYQDAIIRANTDIAESRTDNWLDITPTGFQPRLGIAAINGSGSTYIYLAIRKSNKTPKTGTEVFHITTDSSSVNTNINTGFPVDWQLAKVVNTSSDILSMTRLHDFNSTTATAATNLCRTNTFAIESGYTGRSLYWNNTGFRVPSGLAGSLTAYLSFRRAYGVFDAIAWAGRGTNGALNHNLGATPQLIITKDRYNSSDWRVEYWENGVPSVLALNRDDSAFTPPSYTAPTETVFYPADDISGNQLVGYLFASKSGISKVGKYTGNGSSQTINCGFSNGARFMLIKRISAGGGNWWIPRTNIAGSDSIFALNVGDSEITADAVDPDSTGFIVNQEANCNLNVNGSTYLYLAIA